MDSEQAPATGETPEQDVALPRHLTPGQQEHLRALLDGKTQSIKEHVRDTIADFVALKNQRAELAAATQKASAVLQALRMETAATDGALDKCIRDVTRWEVESKPKATNPPPASRPNGGERKTKKTKKRGQR